MNSMIVRGSLLVVMLSAAGAYGWYSWNGWKVYERAQELASKERWSTAALAHQVVAAKYSFSPWARLSRWELEHRRVGDAALGRIQGTHTPEALTLPENVAGLDRFSVLVLSAYIGLVSCAAIGLGFRTERLDSSRLVGLLVLGGTAAVFLSMLSRDSLARFRESALTGLVVAALLVVVAVSGMLLSGKSGASSRVPT
jgi:hypothetical protein